MSNIKKWGATLAFVALIAAASPASYRFLSGAMTGQDRPGPSADGRSERTPGQARADAIAARDAKAPAGARTAGGLQPGSGKVAARRFAVMPRNRLPGGGFAYNELLNAGDGVDRPAVAVETVPQGTPGTFIVLFDEPALSTYQGGTAGIDMPPRELHASGKKGRIDTRSIEAQNYVGYLQGRQQLMEEQMASVAGRDLEVRHRMQHAVNGIIVDMSAEESARIARLPGVRLVEAYREYVQDTDVGPTLIGAPIAWAGADPFGAAPVQGEGVVIGVIDSGVNFGSPSFAATDPVDGYVHVNPLGAGTYLGTCIAGQPDDGRCNSKLIGGYDFVCGAPANQCGAANVREEPGFGDTNTHGSHVASTIVGNRRNVVFNGAPLRISGVAPRANMIAYDVCYTNTSTGQGLCPNAATVAAINQTVIDGVDVLNYSISGGVEPWSEATSLAFLSAVDAGVYAAASAGNSGPAANTLGHLEPWVGSTAASQHGRGGFGTLMQVTGPAPVPAELQPVAMLNGIGGVELAASLPGTTPLRVSAGIDTTNDGCAAFPAGTFTGAIAVIRRGTCSFSIKTNNAAAAGALAVVISNNTTGGIIPSVPGTTIAAFGVTQAIGNSLRNFNTANPSATAQVTVPAVGLPNVADALAGFSSRGPAGRFDLVKPDITAPGSDILAVTAGTTLTGFEQSIGLLSGTSMASPHHAGAAALIRQARPGWTVPEIKSALMLTATPQVYLEDQVSPANAFARGSGRIRIDRALKAGLVMNETTANFQAANPGIGGNTHSLNLPSLGRANCFPTCQFTRTFRNGQTTGSLWRVEVLGVPGTANTQLMWVPAGSSRSLTVSINGTVLPSNGSFTFGSLQLTRLLSGVQTDEAAGLSLPIAVAVPPPVVSLPASVATSVTAGANGGANFNVGNVGGAILNYTVVSTGNGSVTPANALSTGVSSGFRNVTYTDPATAGFNGQYSADDFDVVQTTQLQSLRVEGFAVSGAALATAALDITWTLFPDAGGLPSGGMLPVTGAVWTFTALPTAPGVSISGGSITLNLAAAGQNVSLPPGKYWLVANTRGSFANRFAQYGSNTGSGGFASLSVPLAGGGVWEANNALPGLTMTVRGQVACGAPWLGAATPASGALSAGNVQATSVVLNSSALAAGPYVGSVCVASNDIVTPTAALPVVLTVNP